MKKNTILVIAAHPDDEVLGCGATLSRLAEEKNEIHIFILGEGITSRNRGREAKIKLAKLHKAAEKAASIIGANDIEIYNFPDNRFDNLDLLDIVKIVERKKNLVKPNILYTHHANDLNIDHRKTFQAVLTACRPISGETVKEIYAFEVLSSTEWQVQNSNNSFFPQQYIVVEKSHFKRKIKAMQAYSSEIRKYPHPRSKEAIEILARWRGLCIGTEYAECFEVVRRIS